MHIGSRLKMVAALCPASTTLADIGTDHAYLPVFLVLEGKIKKAIAGDIVPGPCEAAQRTVRTYHLEQQINVRQGSGLTILSPGEAETIVMAGMGAGTMRDILAASPEIWQEPSCQHLILQPQNESEKLRHWAEDNGWEICREELVEEADRLYEVLHLCPHPGWKYPSSCYTVGANLVERQHPLLGRLLQEHIKKIKRQLQGMEKSEHARQSFSYEKACMQLKQWEALQDGGKETC